MEHDYTKANVCAATRGRSNSRKRRNPCTVCLDPIRLILEGMFLQYERPIFLRPLEVHPENGG
jgi:hypothetical protein